MHLLAVDGDDALRRIDDQGTEIEELLVFGILGDDLGAIHTAQQRLAAGDELAHGERLGHVIIGSGTEADDLIGLVVSCLSQSSGFKNTAPSAGTVIFADQSRE